MKLPAWASRFSPRSRSRAVAAAVFAPAVATAVALPIPHRPAAGAVALYMVAVVCASLAGGLWAGLAAAVMSFFGLNYFFTEPFHTLLVRRLEDVLALAVFAVIAAVVAILLARVLEERQRAERSTSEARNMSSFTMRLLSDEPVERTLESAAYALADLFDLESCVISADIAGAPMRIEAVQPHRAPAAGPRLEIPLDTGGRSPGSLLATRRGGGEEFHERERVSLEAFAGQVAIALQRANYDAQIRAARVEAETSDLRAALFSSITHDLRTPLASITASVSSLLDPDVVHDDAQREELLRTSLEEANRLNRVVGNLLDLARMRAGALTPSVELMPIEEVAEAVLGRMRRSLEGLRVRTFIRDDLPLLAIDPIQIDQVLTNLLENAVRFSGPDGELTVSVHRVDSVVEVRVADAGPGVPPEDRERVFEPFYKRDVGGGRGGTGLGLAISRAIVVAHGGRIWIDGAPGGGTAVTFQLPVPAARPESPRGIVADAKLAR